MERSHILRFILLSLVLISFLRPASSVQGEGELVLVLTAASQTVKKGGDTVITASLTDASGNAVNGQEITFTASMGVIYPTSAITGSNGQASVDFIAGDEVGVSTITASTEGASATVDVTVEELSIFQWIIYVLLCILGILGAGGGTALYLRRKKAQAALKQNTSPG